MNREDYLTIVKKYNENNNLVKHAIAVESVMRYFAKNNNEDIEKWGAVGLLHDIDYEKYPNEHCIKCKELLENENVDSDIIRAVQSHGYGICSDVKPELYMEKVLYTIDELTGLITATALMQPNKTLEEVSVQSIKKKWKNKGFASGVNRELIAKGAQMLNIDLDFLIEETLNAMKESHEKLGL